MSPYVTCARIGCFNRVRSLCLCFFLVCAIFVRGMALGESAADLSARATHLMQKGDYAEAERLFLKLTVVAPNVPEVYSNLGLAQYYEKKHGLARRAFARAISLNKDLFVPRFFLAKMDCEDGKYASALPQLREAVKLNPGEPASRNLLADVLSQISLKTEAIAQYKEVLKQQPRDETALAGLTRVYLDEARRCALLLKTSDPHFAAVLKAESDSMLPGFEPAAVDEWNAAFADLPISGPRIGFANFLLNSNRLSEAEAVFRKELAIDPFSYKALFGLAELGLLKGDLEAAVKNSDESVRIRPEFFNPLPPLSLLPEHLEQYYATIKTQGGGVGFGHSYLTFELAEKAGMSDEAARWQADAQARRDEIYQEIRANLRKDRVPSSYEGRRTLGLKYLSEKRLDEGLQLLMPLVKTTKADSKMELTISRALFEEQRFEDVEDFLSGSQKPYGEVLYLQAASYKTTASQTMDALAAVNPQSVDLQKLVAESFSDRKMFKEAAEQYHSALQVRPDDPDLYFGLGEADFSQMKFEDAADAYSHAIELRPWDAAFYVMRASALVELNRPAEAISLSKRALELNPNLLQAHVSLGRSLALMGRDQEAVQELEKAASTDNDGMLHYGLLKLYRKLGRLDDAKRAMEVSNQLRRRANSGSEHDSAPAPEDGRTNY
jgi:tetratricopeptide (TPR) repeat protein